MSKRNPFSAWTRVLKRSLAAGTKTRRAVAKPLAVRKSAPRGGGDWIAGVAMGVGGARRYRLFRPPGVAASERLPLMVMLHGCHQDATSFAESTRMNTIARRHRFLVLYPEQDRMSNPHGCWNWYETRNGRARSEMALILQAIEQVCVLYGADRDRIAVAGLSAGASMAALLASHEPARFKAVIMHSGIPPGTASSTATAVQAMRGGRGTAALEPLSAEKLLTWPALMVIHGGRDSVVAARNGIAAADTWAEATQARAGAGRIVQRGNRYPMRVTDFTQGRSLRATHVAIDSLAHAWSGGAKGLPYGDPAGPDASRLAWAFAARQFVEPRKRLPLKAVA